jgi:putative transcriptional regulator
MRTEGSKGPDEKSWKKRKVGMPIEVKLDMMLVKRKKMLKELSEAVGISMTNLSLLKTGRVKGVKFSTLAKICRELDCQPGDLLEYVADYV